MVEKYQRDLSETQAALYEEGQTRGKLQMELDSKDSEIELLQQKLSVINVDTASIHSGSLEDDSLLHNSSISSESWPQSYKTFSCSTLLSMKFKMLINTETAKSIKISGYQSQ